MSVKVMGQVWELDLDHSRQSVLIAMADHADHEGEHVFPSIALISWKTGYSERQIQRILRSLEASGLIEVVGNQEGGRGKTTEYRLRLERGRKKAPFRSEKNEATPSLRDKVMKRDGQVCQHCKSSGDAKLGPDGRPWQLDRIIPGKLNGKYTLENVCLSCETCNKRKGAKIAPFTTERVPSTTQKGAIAVAPPLLTVSEPKDLKPLPPEKDPAVRRLIQRFHDKHIECKGFKPVIRGGSNGKLLKSLLRLYPERDLGELITWFLSGKESERLSSSLGVCLSESVVNKWLSVKTGKTGIGKMLDAAGRELKPLL